MYRNPMYLARAYKIYRIYTQYFSNASKSNVSRIESSVKHGETFVKRESMNRLIRKRRRVYFFFLDRNATEAILERRHRSSPVDRHDQHGRPIYLEVIALSSHQGRVRVGEVRAMITVHYAVHVAHVHQLAGTLHARHAHTRAESVRDELARAHRVCAINIHTPSYLLIPLPPSLLSTATAWRLEFASRFEISPRGVTATRGRVGCDVRIFLEKTHERNFSYNFIKNLFSMNFHIFIICEIYT